LFELFLIFGLVIGDTNTQNLFPVPDNVLYQIWDERGDLQAVYPEVAHDQLNGLKEWATKSGWKEDSRLYALIPKNQTPSYSTPPPTSKPNNDIMIGELTVGSITAIAIILVKVVRPKIKRVTARNL
jgi:hypothetical protein